MFTKIALENFKGIRERVEIELRPITLLFGGNSAGKSTILHALHYAHEVLERHNLDPDRTLKGGEFVDLGGFENLVHGHDRERPVRFEITFEATEHDLPEYLPPPPDYEEGLSRLDTLIEQFSTVTVAWEVRWSHSHANPYVSKYDVLLDGHWIASIVSTPGSVGQTALMNMDHPSLLAVRSTELGDNMTALDQSGVEFGDSGLHHGDSGLRFLCLFAIAHGLVPSLKHGRVHTVDGVGVVHTVDNAGGESGVGKGEILACVLGVQSDAMPRWGESLAYESVSWSSVKGIEVGLTSRWEAIFNETLSRILVGAGESLRNSLRQFRYLGPIRTVPPRDSHPPRFPDESRWSTGIAAWDRLQDSSDTLTDAVSDWLGDEERLNAGYRVGKRRFKELDLANPLVVQLLTGRAFDDVESDARVELDKLPTHERVLITPVGGDIDLQPQDVGIGISQVVPVLVIALDGDGRLVAIEQPELHLHPRIEAELGDLFIATAIRENGQQFLLETHSEHLVLRLLRRIREATDDHLRDENSQMPAESVFDPFPTRERRGGLKPDDVAVIYVERGEQGTTVQRLRIDETGEFLDRWPKGFFAERAKELF